MVKMKGYSMGSNALNKLAHNPRPYSQAIIHEITSESQWMIVGTTIEEQAACYEESPETEL